MVSEAEIAWIWGPRETVNNLTRSSLDPESLQFPRHTTICSGEVQILMETSPQASLELRKSM